MRPNQLLLVRSLSQFPSPLHHAPHSTLHALNVLNVPLHSTGTIPITLGDTVWTKHASFYFMCLTPVMLALAASLSLSSLPGFGLRREERVAVAIETSYQVSRCP